MIATDETSPPVPEANFGSRFLSTSIIGLFLLFVVVVMMTVGPPDLSEGMIAVPP